MIRFLLLLFILPLLYQATCQTVRIDGITEDETALYARTKQVNQFFRRFNNEEDRFGKKYKPSDTLYRHSAFRKTYLEMLFDKENAQISPELKQEFIREVTADSNARYLNFHGDCWFAELAATFQYNKKKENMILFLRLEQENLGYKWVLTNVYFDKFLKLFFKGEEEQVKKTFLHPLSHEIDFMNINKAFMIRDYTEYYAFKGYRPDYLTILMYELKMGNLRFENVGTLKFHFFQVPGWYFELSYINRPGLNTGWLITKLYRITEKEKEELIRFYLP